MTLLGIDVGTTGVKALAFDTSTGEYHITQRSYDLLFPQTDRVEQSPDQIWQATKSAASEALATAGEGAEPVSVSISSQGGTLIPLDDEFKTLGNAVVWMDHRAKALGDALNKEFGKDFFYMKTGWPLTGCLPFIQIHWLKDERPGFFRKVSRFAFVGDYIAYKLSGKWIADPSSASITMLYNLRKGAWDDELVEMAGIREDQLPQVADSGSCIGTVEPSVASELGIQGREVSISSGGHDQYCASLGAGALEKGDLLLSGGTAWVMLLTSERPVFDTRSYLSPGRHVVRGRWGLMSSISGAGAGVNWLGGLLRGKMAAEGGEREFYRRIEAESDKVPPGSERLFFFPHFLGSTAPTWETEASAAIVGLGLHHRPAHMFRALLEGIGFDILWNVETFRGLGAKVSSGSMIGGAAKSRIWPQIISDILGLPIRIPRIQEAACVGAAILGGLGAGVIRDYREVLDLALSDSSFIEPDPSRSQRYKELFLSYRDTFRKLLDARDNAPTGTKARPSQTAPRRDRQPSRPRRTSSRRPRRSGERSPPS